MNIFKILASSLSKFREDQASAMLAWLLNPYMEHGLGYEFLKRFCKLCNVSIDLPSSISLRGNLEDTCDLVAVNLEENVVLGRIDIAVFYKNMVLSIENKIYSESALNPRQLIDQYKGLKDKYTDRKIFVVFLTPDNNHYTEFDCLNISVESGDYKTQITWNDVSSIIISIIEDENKGAISPVSEYVKHTLKAFSNFINEGFSGYYYPTDKTQSGPLNPKAQGKKTYAEIKADKNALYVGVNNGISGLLRFETDNLLKKEFQFTSENMQNIRKWMTKKIFVTICDSIIANKFVSLEWFNEINKLKVDLIFKVATKTDVPFFIGIKGGRKALANLSIDTIEAKRWGISLSKDNRNNQWITKDEFVSILEKKGFVSEP